jgi:hypothetical protein
MVDANGNKWLNLLKRLTMMAKTQHVNHAKVIKVTLITDPDGNLAVWSVPDRQGLGKFIVDKFVR